MRSSIVRNVVAPFALLAVALVAGRAEANPPNVSCQSNAPHHTVTLGAGVDSVSTTSTLNYWDNACGCYVAQIDVPSTSSSSNPSRFEKRFSFGPPDNAWLNGTPKDVCLTIKDRFYVYKKVSGAFVLQGGGSEAHGEWVHGVPPLSQPGTPASNYCALAGGTAIPPFDPPATGSDTYRVLRSAQSGGKFMPVTLTASHLAVIH